MSWASANKGIGGQRYDQDITLLAGPFQVAYMPRMHKVKDAVSMHNALALGLQALDNGSKLIHGLYLFAN